MLDEVVRVLTNIIVLVAWPGQCDHIKYIILSSCSPNERGKNPHYLNNVIAGQLIASFDVSEKYYHTNIGLK